MILNNNQTVFKQKSNRSQSISITIKQHSITLNQHSIIHKQHSINFNYSQTLSNTLKQHPRPCTSPLIFKNMQARKPASPVQPVRHPTASPVTSTERLINPSIPRSASATAKSNAATTIHPESISQISETKNSLSPTTSLNPATFPKVPRIRIPVHPSQITMAIHA